MCSKSDKIVIQRWSKSGPKVINKCYTSDPTVIQKWSKEATGHHGGPLGTTGGNGGQQREATGGNVIFRVTVLNP
eukprot:16428043-Heterocapsa_arctica.AAC.1